VDAALQAVVKFFKPLGLNYSFLLDATERMSFLHGMLVTLQLCIWIIPVSLLFGVLIAAGVSNGPPWLSRPLRAFIELTRNTPTLVQLYCAFLVLNMLITQRLGNANPFTPFIWVVLVIGLHKAAFHAEALRAGIGAVPPVMLESARSLAFSRTQTLVRVQLPLALRFALPALVNNLVELVKMTAIASAIAVGDVTYESIMIWSHRDNVLELLLLILVYFGLLTWLVGIAGHWLESRLRMAGYGQ
jgi:polar amino acid transport system permease protein